MSVRDLNTRALSDKFQQIQINAELTRWLFATVRFGTIHAIRYLQLFTIRYSGFPDTLKLHS